MVQMDVLSWMRYVKAVKLAADPAMNVSSIFTGNGSRPGHLPSMSTHIVFKAAPRMTFGINCFIHISRVGVGCSVARNFGLAHERILA